VPSQPSIGKIANRLPIARPCTVRIEANGDSGAASRMSSHGIVAPTDCAYLRSSAGDLRLAMRRYALIGSNDTTWSLSNTAATVPILPSARSKMGLSISSTVGLG